MYGIVHGAMRALVVQAGGPPAWSSLVAGAGLEEPVHLAYERYDDEDTLKLVGAFASQLGLDAAAALERLGEAWVPYAVDNGYGAFLGRPGDDPFEALHGLDDMHSRLALAFPGYRPPSFLCSTLEQGGLRLRYASERAGLAPFVVGLVRGLGDFLGTPLAVSLVQVAADGRSADLDVCKITP